MQTHAITPHRTDPTWPHQVRLPGQTDVAQGPVDLTSLYLVHHALRRDVTAFAAAVGETPVAQADTWRALAVRWERFCLALHHHQRLEDDQIWPALRQRVDVSELSVLGAMEAEHEAVDPALQACGAAFRRLAAVADPDARRALAVRVAGLREALGRHLRREETEAVPLVQRFLTQEVWDGLEASARREVRIGELLWLVPWVLHEVPAELRSQAFERPRGRSYEVLWRLTRRRFEAQERRVFVCADPPAG